MNPTAARIVQVNGQMENLENEIASFDGLFTDLEKKLSVVMSPQPPAGPGDGAEKALCPLASRIGGSIKNIAQLKARLLAIHNGLEI